MTNSKEILEAAKDEAWKKDCISIAEITENNMKTDVIIYDKGFDAGAEFERKRLSELGTFSRFVFNPKSQCEDGSYDTFPVSEDERAPYGHYCLVPIEEVQSLNAKLEAAIEKLKKANELILFDIDSASDGAAMNHEAKLDKYRKELSQNGSKMEGK
jgi:hypothetical protein